jgi:signal transduction histidine kinase
VASVCFDAVGCSFALATNVIAPGDGYQGLLRMPDIASVLVVTMAVGLRLSLRATIYGAVLNVAGAVALIGVDVVRNGPTITYHARDVVLFGMLLVSAIVLATAVATRARSLAHEGGVKTVVADRAEKNMWEVLQDSHEMKSALSAVAMETDLFLRAAERGEDIDRVGTSLREELRSLNALVASVRERTYAELAAKQGGARVEVRPAIDDAIARLRGRFPSVAIERAGDDVEVLLAGGRASLDRILTNLIVNACEGNGTAVPTRVTIEASAEDDRIALDVRDDGPGFSTAVLASPIDRRGATTKKEGSGLGLFFVHSIVTASGGTVDRSNLAKGARVRVLLPRGQRRSTSENT